MNEGGQRQRLEAILAADAAGYSRLMEMDEPATLAALERARSIFRAEIESHHGHVINMPGDSVLAVFDTASGAVSAALAVQRTLDAANADVAPDSRLRFRIGVHLGDVIENPDGDIHGDGVNIASRLQALAKPGGIVVSEAVRGAVKSRVAAAFDDLGTQSVKNIADPVRAFAVRQEGSPKPAAPPARPASKGPPQWVGWFAAAAVVLLIAGGIAWWQRPTSARDAPAQTTAQAPPAPRAASGKPSIAVLPFDNMSGDADRAYFSDGITEDLITDLSKVAGLVVIARNSTFQYKGKAHDVREIGKALNARYVLEGSVRRSGDTVRVNAQLIDAPSGAHIWAERYDGELKNIFGLQDTITRNVVKALSVELTKDESDRVAKRGTGNIQAYDVLLQGWEHYLKQTPDDFRVAIVDFKKAAELDPTYSRAYAALATIYWESYTRYWGVALGLGRDTQADAEQYLAKAMRDPTPLAHEVASAMLAHNQQHAEAIAEAQRAVASDPNDADGYVALAGALSFAGRPAEALDAVEKAMRLNPHYPSSYAYQRGLALFGLNRLDEATAALERAIELNRDDYWSQRLLLAIYGLTGKREDARRLTETIKSNDRRGRGATWDPLTIRAVSYWYPFAKPDDAKRFAAGLAKAGVPD
ncbi:MAG TPA: adenylate/guanylate cyclase domain-containing protein [Casimicrobiaceae bacterium]|nr:adenylate/guanylate cyclase domain-containing protein [Casimicrobiaceae bacterium]